MPETQSERGKQTNTRDRQTVTETRTDIETGRGRDIDGKTDRKTDSQMDRETGSQRQKDSDTKGDSWLSVLNAQQPVRLTQGDQTETESGR